MSSAMDATAETVSGAVARVTGSVRDLQRALEEELGGKDIPRAVAPETLTEAYAEAQATEQALADAGITERRRKEMDDADAVKAWAKPPGASLVDADVAPFLAYHEEYFRHVAPADVANLLPAGPAKLEDDPDFRIPPLGRYYVLGASRPNRTPRARAPPPPPRKVSTARDRRPTAAPAETRHSCHFSFSPTARSIVRLPPTTRTRRLARRPPDPATPRARARDPSNDD